MDVKKTEASFRSLVREIDYLENIKSTLEWDMRVNLPLKAGEYRGDSIAFLSGEIKKRKTSPEMREYLSVLSEQPSDDIILNAMVKKFEKEYGRQAEVPAELAAEFASHNLKTEFYWQEARKNNDYKSVIPFVKREFELEKMLQACHGFEDDPLSGLMDEWEPGVTRPVMDRLFGDLKDFELPFIEKIKASPVKPDGKAYLGYYPAEKQAKLCREVLCNLGFDFERGRMDVSPHPYTTGNDIHDMRLTTHFYEENFTMAVCSCLHEGGHALTGQNCDPSLRFTTLEHMKGAGMNEAQSRFTENVIGRSPEYWEFALPMAQKYFPQLKEFTPETFYSSMNSLHFSPHRLKSDELTYNLHIIMRYELEKQLFDGDISFEDLPQLWNDKSEEYLGVRPASDAEGVLQDMHWFSGYIGYFQTYVLGNFYDGHFLKAMKKDIPDMFERVRRGDLKTLTGWMGEKIHRFAGLYTPAEILKQVDGEGLTAQHYIEYIKERYSRIYRL